MKRLAIFFFLCSEVSTLAGSAQDASPTNDHCGAVVVSKGKNVFEVSDLAQGCFHYNKIQTQIPKNLTAADAAKLSQLSSAISESKRDQSLDCSKLGITTSVFNLNRKVLKETLKKSAYVLPEIADKWVDDLKYSDLDKLIKERTKMGEYSTNYFEIKGSVVIGEKTIRFSSDHSCPLMIPWHMDDGEEEWDSFSPELAQSLAKLLKKEGACKSFLNESTYWKDGFWRDAQFWRIAVADSLEQKSLERLSTKWAGASKAQKIFKTATARYNKCFNPEENSIYHHLAVTQPSLLAAVEWFNPTPKGQATSNWNEMLAVYSKTCNAINQHPWISKWKDSKGGNTVRGKRGVHMDIPEVIRQWKSKGLKGEPETEIFLVQNRSDFMTLYLSSSEPTKALAHAGAAAKGEPTDFLERMNSAKYEKDRITYAVIDNKEH